MLAIEAIAHSQTEVNSAVSWSLAARVLPVLLTAVGSFWLLLYKIRSSNRHERLARRSEALVQAYQDWTEAMHCQLLAMHEYASASLPNANPSYEQMSLRADELRRGYARLRSILLRLNQLELDGREGRVGEAKELTSEVNPTILASPRSDIAEKWTADFVSLLENRLEVFCSQLNVLDDVENRNKRKHG